MFQLERQILCYFPSFSWINRTGAIVTLGPERESRTFSRGRFVCTKWLIPLTLFRNNTISVSNLYRLQRLLLFRVIHEDRPADRVNIFTLQPPSTKETEYRRNVLVHVKEKKNADICIAGSVACVACLLSRFALSYVQRPCSKRLYPILKVFGERLIVW